MHIFAFVFLTIVACATGGGSSTGGSSGGKALPKQSQPCDPGGKCDSGLECVKYYGILGPRGPQFTSCEIRCSEGGKCPTEQSCRIIADGPGRVCRPKKN
jgi:hypothetical protein